MTPEEIAELIADREAGTPGPWQTGAMVPTAVFNWWLPADHPNACICECTSEVDARRIAGLPGLEAQVLRLTEANAALAEELARSRNSLAEVMAFALSKMDDRTRADEMPMFRRARAALSHTGMTGQREGV
jgi:hypothetical protein